jgi:hypothetical protein
MAEIIGGLVAEVTATATHPPIKELTAEERAHLSTDKDGERK